MRARRGLCVGALALLAVLAAASPAGAVPRTFFGVVPQDPLTSRDFNRMRGVVGKLRLPVLWSQLEPSPASFDFSALDEVVLEASTRKLAVMPYVYGSPQWLTGDYARPPQGSAAGRAAWSSLLRRLVDRYGPGGSLWDSRDNAVPIREWQIWNEPNFVIFWRPKPSAAAYARLLALSARAIRAEDPEARIVTAGLAPVEGGQWPWGYLRRLYRVAGVKRSFDVVGLHPYASSLASLEYQLDRTRAAMAGGHDLSTPIQVTEFGVASEGFAESPMVKSRLGQASFLRRAYRLLIENRRRWGIESAYWFTWRDGSAPVPYCIFCEHAGLFDARGRGKPAWGAYRRVVSASVRPPRRRH